MHVEGVKRPRGPLAVPAVQSACGRMQKNIPGGGVDSGSKVCGCPGLCGAQLRMAQSKH